MVEFQRCRAVDASHESGDQRPIRIADAVSTAAVDRFAGERRLQRIQGAVHVHDQQVQAVATCPVARGDGANDVAGELVVVDFGYCECLQALREHLGFRHSGRSQRLQHLGDIGHGVLDDCMCFRDAVAPAVHSYRTAHYLIQVAVLDSSRQALGVQAGGRRLRSFSMGPGRLQQGETVFDAVIGCQRHIDQAGQQQGGLVQRVQDTGLFCHPGRLSQVC